MAGLGPQLEATGAAEFWNRAWSEKRTMWKLSEMQVNTFSRNIFYFVMGLPSHQGNPCTLPFIATNDSNKADQLHQPEMERAVRDFITKKNVLVPLCGDTEAVRFMIEHGASLVVGADLSRAALESLMSTHFSDWKFNTRSVAKDAAVVFEGHSEKHTGQSVMLFCGDYLRLVDCPDFAQLKVDFIYDRAAYMAMHPSLRQEYTAVAAKVLQPGAAGVLLERPRREEGDVRGPPFTFCVDEARRFYETATGRSFTLKALVEDRWRADPEGKSPVLFFDWHGLYPSS